MIEKLYLNKAVTLKNGPRPQQHMGEMYKSDLPSHLLPNFLFFSVLEDTLAMTVNNLCY